MSEVRPRRSVLYLPASNERALEKAKSLPVDGLILDLEDAVAPDAKSAARELACAAAVSGAYGMRELTIRINGLGSPWHEDDSPRATFQQDLWHYTVARMVDACAAAGIYPYYGPFGDIGDPVGCEDQFRAAFLLGCVGAWSLHPSQIAIAKRVFSPSAEDVAHARRVVAAMGDGTGAVMLDGRMEDDASLKQCRVLLDLAERLATLDPELAEAYGMAPAAA